MMKKKLPFEIEKKMPFQFFIMIEKPVFVCLGFHQTDKSFIEHFDPESRNVAVASFVQHLQNSFFFTF